LVELLVLLPGGAADGSEGDGDEQAQDQPRRYDREHHHAPEHGGEIWRTGVCYLSIRCQNGDRGGRR
jgi:hypothetical protein